MIERNQRPDIRLEQRIHQAAVMIDTLGICGARPGGLDAGPRDRKAVAVQIKRPHEGNVLAPAMIGVASQVARVAVSDFAWSVREAVPNGLALAVFIPRAFNLVGGGGRAPEKSLRKCDRGRGVELMSRRAGW